MLLTAQLRGDCVYEASPLTPIQRRPTKDSIPAALPSPSTSNPQPPSVGYPTTPVTPVDESPAAGNRDGDYSNIENSGDGQVVETVPLNPGFLGSTSYSSIFDENLEHLGVPATINQLEYVSSKVCSEYIDQGIEVLRIFRNRSLIDAFHDRLDDLNLCLCIPRVLGRGWRERLWSTFGSVLAASKTAELHALSEHIWSNTLRPLKVDGSTNLRTWLESTSGPNLRWPILGILACIVGIGSLTLIRSDPIFMSADGTTINPRRLAICMWEAAETCIKFCREYEVIDDLFVLLLCESDAFTGSIRGEISRSTSLCSRLPALTRTRLRIVPEIGRDDECYRFTGPSWRDRPK
jgi:hypothetical protein